MYGSRASNPACAVKPSKSPARSNVSAELRLTPALRADQLQSSAAPDPPFGQREKSVRDASAIPRVRKSLGSVPYVSKRLPCLPLFPKRRSGSARPSLPDGILDRGPALHQTRDRPLWKWSARAASASDGNVGRNRRFFEACRNDRPSVSSRFSDVVAAAASAASPGPAETVRQRSLSSENDCGAVFVFKTVDQQGAARVFEQSEIIRVDLRARGK